MFFNDHFCTVFHFFVNVMLLQQTFYPSGMVLDTYSTHFHSFPSFSDDFTFGWWAHHQAKHIFCHFPMDYSIFMTSDTYQLLWTIFQNRCKPCLRISDDFRWFPIILHWFSAHFCILFHFSDSTWLQWTSNTFRIVLETYPIHFSSSARFSDDFTFNCPSTDKHMTHSVIFWQIILLVWLQTVTYYCRLYWKKYGSPVWAFPTLSDILQWFSTDFQHI